AAGCTDDIVTSDHSPVFGSFEVGVTSQFVSKKGLSKSSEQAYIEFESIEAIVKTASRTKFFIEFYSTCLEEFKKSFENDSQSSDNINFLKVQWSSRQLPTLKPILSEIEYLQDQHLLLTVKSLDGYESYGECVIALKSMIGSTAQQFLTYLSHRGEETGNIRGSMKVRVPAERLGTRERLYEWISIDKDETAAGKGKVPLGARANQDYAKYGGQGLAGRGSTGGSQLGVPGGAWGSRGGGLEGLSISQRFGSTGIAQSIPPGWRMGRWGRSRCWLCCTGQGWGARCLRERCWPRPWGLSPITGGRAPSWGAEPHPGGPSPAPGRPSPVGHPTPLVAQMAKTLSEVDYAGGKGRAAPPPPLLAKGGRLELPPRCLHPDYGRPIAFPPHSIRESIQEDLAEEVGVWGGGCQGAGTPGTLHQGSIRGDPGGVLRVGAALCQAGRGVGAVPGVGEWLRALGLERYEEGLVRNGWDDLEFLSDITEEDLEEAGVLDPGHKCVLLESLQLRK
ncbi:Phosphatidylinositol 3,4,5-trisphosphate 5-phosphatase 2, partial [Eudyptes sclateri]